MGPHASWRPTQPRGGGEQELHLRDYLRVLSERRWILIGVWALILGAVTAYTLSQVPVYRATALVLIEPTQANIANVQNVYDPTGGSSLREYYRTQHELLKSRRVAEPVFHDTGLDRSPDFADAQDPLSGFLDRVSVEPLRDSRLVRVGFDSKSPEEAAKVANAVVQSYMSDNQQRVLGVSDAGLADLKERAKELKAKVGEAAAKMQAFRSDNDFAALDDAVDVLTARLRTLNEELARAQTERIRAAAEVAALEHGSYLGPDAATADGRAIEQLQLEVMQLEREHRALELRVTPEHPQLLALAARLELARQGLGAARDQAMLHTRQRLEAAGTVEAALRAAVEEQSDLIVASNRHRSDYSLLAQDHDALSRTYEGVLVRIQEVELTTTTGSKETNVFLIERALPPVKPIRPRKALNLAGGALFGLAAGVLLCFFVDYLDRSLKSRDEVERLLQTSVLGALPGVVQDETDQGPVELVPVQHPRSPLADAFQAQRTSLSFALLNGTGRGRRLVVSSSAPAEGKTLTAVGLATALAQAGKRVLLIDADLRRPRVHEIFGLDNDRGLSTLLSGDDALEDLETTLLRPATSVPRLDLLTSGPPPPNPADLLTSDRMGALLQSCEGTHDWVIVDAPPALVADPVILATHVGSCLLVVRLFSTQREQVRHAAEQLTVAGAKLVGAVLNQVDLPAGTGGYGYGYGYGAYSHRPEGERG